MTADIKEKEIINIISFFMISNINLAFGVMLFHVVVL